MVHLRKRLLNWGRYGDVFCSFLGIVSEAVEDHCCFSGRIVAVEDLSCRNATIY